jgi:hypothetical protein
VEAAPAIGAAAIAPAAAAATNSGATLDAAGSPSASPRLRLSLPAAHQGRSVPGTRRRDSRPGHRRHVSRNGRDTRVSNIRIRVAGTSAVAAPTSDVVLDLATAPRLAL